MPIRNRILAAAVITANERLDRRDRFAPSIEYSERFVGDEHKQWLASISSARERIQAGIELDNLLVTGSESPRTRIERGLRQRGLAA